MSVLQADFEEVDTNYQQYLWISYRCETTYHATITDKDYLEETKYETKYDESSNTFYSTPYTHYKTEYHNIKHSDTVLTTGERMVALDSSAQQALDNVEFQNGDFSSNVKKTAIANTNICVTLQSHSVALEKIIRQYKKEARQKCKESVKKYIKEYKIDTGLLFPFTIDTYDFNDKIVNAIHYVCPEYVVRYQYEGKTYESRGLSAYDTIYNVTKPTIKGKINESAMKAIQAEKQEKLKEFFAQRGMAPPTEAELFELDWEMAKLKQEYQKVQRKVYGKNVKKFKGRKFDEIVGIVGGLIMITIIFVIIPTIISGISNGEPFFENSTEVIEFLVFLVIFIIPAAYLIHRLVCFVKWENYCSRTQRVDNLLDQIEALREKHKN